ncbi:MAG: tRNA (guanosine(46)-N7)-methyltransferase TrmB [bacterium]
MTPADTDDDIKPATGDYDSDDSDHLRILKPHPLFLEMESLGDNVSFQDIFGNDQPVEIEVGSGKALFLRQATQARPQHNFLGIEIIRKYARHGADRLKNINASNVKILPGDALRFLKKVPDQSVSTVHIYYPDPWWKRKHHKRRVFTTDFVTDVQRILKPGGQFLIATDVGDYYEHVLMLMSEFKLFQTLPSEELNQPSHDLDYLTNFERKFRKQGKPVYRVSYQLVSSSANISGTNAGN